MSDELRVVAVLPQDVQSGAAYLSQNGITVDQVVSKLLSTINVRGTPTVFLLDGSGHIRNVWVGLLDPGREKEVLSALKTLCEHCITT